MPTCSSILHATSGLPAHLPPEHFYSAGPGATTVRSGCKACRRVAARLYADYGRPPWPLVVQHRFWHRYRTRMQLYRTVRAPLAPGQRWCGRGHVAKVEDFVTSPSWCQDCVGIKRVRLYYRKYHQQEVTWEEASHRYYASPRRQSLARNRVAPPGQRWCHRHQGYFVLPEHWSLVTIRRGLCPPCRHAVDVAYRTRTTRGRSAAAA